MPCKEKCLRKKKEFDNVWKNGRSCFDGLFGVKALLNDLPNSRYGISVGLKFSKKAVERNSVKRKVRAFVDSVDSQTKVKADVVIICLPSAKGKESAEIHSSLETLFKKMRLL